MRLSVVSLVSDELQELRRMCDATKLHVAQVLNIKPGVRKYPSVHPIVGHCHALWNILHIPMYIEKNTQTICKWCKEFGAQECG